MVPPIGQTQLDSGQERLDVVSQIPRAKSALDGEEVITRSPRYQSLSRKVLQEQNRPL